MKTYLKRVSATMLCLLVVFCLSAQQRQRMSAEDRAQRETEMMQKELNLTKEQLPKIDSINLFYAKKMNEMMANSDREQMRALMQTNAEQKDEALKGILTDEQYKKLKEIEQQQTRLGQRQGRPGPPMRRNPNR